MGLPPAQLKDACSMAAAGHSGSSEHPFEVTVPRQTISVACVLVISSIMTGWVRVSSAHHLRAHLHRISEPAVKLLSASQCNEYSGSLDGLEAIHDSCCPQRLP